MLAQLACASERTLNLRHSVPLRPNQRFAKRQLQLELEWKLLDRSRQGRQCMQSATRERDCLAVGEDFCRLSRSGGEVLRRVHEVAGSLEQQREVGGHGD